MSTKKAAVAILVAFWVFFTYFSASWINAAEGFRRGNRRRFIAVMRMEMLMTLLNIFVHGQLIEWFDEAVKEASKCERRTLQLHQRRWSAVLVTFLALGQAIYFMYYFPQSSQYFFFDLTAICAGIWTNLIAFVCGFALVNFLAPYFMRLAPTRCLLEALSSVRLIRNLIWDRKTQIKFILAVTLVLSLAMYAYSDSVVIREKTIKIPNFSAEKGPLRIAVVSDIHAGGSVHRRQVAKVADKVMETMADVVLIVGDVVDGAVDDIGDRVEPLWLLADRFPTFFVTGNHEYYIGDVSEWLELYKKHNIHVLQNNHTMLRGVCLAGVNDVSSGKMGLSGHEMNVSAAIRGCPQGKSRVLMSHNPAAVLDFPSQDLQTIDLILSGHTHAGQFYVVVPVVYWMLPYFYGLYEVGPHTKMFVSAGSLFQGPPMKMLGMSEVWLLTLEKA